MAKSEERLKAYELRRQGESVKEIARQLGVSSSSVSLWVRDMHLTKMQKDYLKTRMIAGGNRGRLIGARMNREKKLRQIHLSRTEEKKRVGKLSARDVFMLGCGLYWGEGVKANSSALAIINSDPQIIRLSMRWFSDCFGVTRDRFHPRIFINATHRDREKVLLDFWSKILHIPTDQFAKTIFLEKPNKKIYENHNTYYGVLALRVRRGSGIRYRILADLECISGKGKYMPR